MTQAPTEVAGVRRALAAVSTPLIRQVLLLVPVALDLVVRFAVGGGRLEPFEKLGLLLLLAATAVAVATSSV